MSILLLMPPPVLRAESGPHRPGLARVAGFFPGSPVHTHRPTPPAPTVRSLAPELGCPPSARKLFTKGNNSDKGLKLAGSDGKHFVERSVDKRGNRAVKKIGGVKDTEGQGVDCDEKGDPEIAGAEPSRPEAQTATRRARPKWPVFPLCQWPPSCPMAPGLKALKEGTLTNSLGGWISEDRYQTCFPGGSEGKECLQCWRPEFNPWVGKSPWRRKWQPTPVFLPGEFHGQKSLVSYSPWAC